MLKNRDHKIKILIKYNKPHEIWTKDNFVVMLPHRIWIRTSLIVSFNNNYFFELMYNSIAIIYGWYCEYIINITHILLSLLTLAVQYIILPLTIEIEHLYFILTTFFWVSIFTPWQSPIFSPRNDIVWGIIKYIGSSHINVTSSFAVQITKRLKYTIMVTFALLSIFFL